MGFAENDRERRSDAELAHDAQSVVHLLEALRETRGFCSRERGLQLRRSCPHLELERFVLLLERPMEQARRQQVLHANDDLGRLDVGFLVIDDENCGVLEFRRAPW